MKYFVLFFSLFAFGVLTALTMNGYDFLLDGYFFDHIHLVWNETLTSFMIVITNLVSPLIFMSLAILTYIYLAIRKCAYYDLLFAYSLIFTFISYVAFKNITHISRPEFALTSITDWSFPSGHTAMATTFILVLLYTFKDEIKSAFLRNVYILLGFLLIGTIGFSRIYLAVHRPSEVVAGFLLAVFSVTLWSLILGHFHHHRNRENSQFDIR